MLSGFEKGFSDLVFDCEERISLYFLFPAILKYVLSSILATRRIGHTRNRFYIYMCLPGVQSRSLKQNNIVPVGEPIHRLLLESLTSLVLMLTHCFILSR